MADLAKMVEAARSLIKNNGTQGALCADILYRIILRETTPPTTGNARIAHGEACVWNAHKALSRGKLGEAADWYLEAVHADPYATDYRIELCVKAFVPMGMLKEARIEAERATKIDPTYPPAWRTLGGIEHKLSNVEEAVFAYDKQIELDPDNPNAALDRSTIALDTADYATVRRLCKPLLDTDRRPDALHCLAMAAYREAKHEEAIEIYDQAIAAKCFDVPLARWNKALALHSIGRYREGWLEHENRGDQSTDGAMALMMRRFSAPIWKKQPPPASIHLHQEMGAGDALAMVRYAPILAEQGYDVRLEVNPDMVSLMARSFPNVKVMAKAKDYPAALGIPVFDYHIPMLSLPYLMETDVDTVPWNGPYLKPDPELVAKYRSQVPSGAVGLCWSSGIRQEGLWLKTYGLRKSIPFGTLMPIIDNTDVPLVSLQVGPERNDLYPPVIDLLPKKPNWDDTAALIECLDLVITVDTAVAHLAGAMGKPVWLMMQQDGASWHWMCERPGAAWNERSPWYPSVQIFRQKTVGDWTDVVHGIAQRLDQKISLVA
jgi:tetratricopeptide (TPR) repeat protein